jgi:coenzyme PQQ precursor peptide PqqA
MARPPRVVLPCEVSQMTWEAPEFVEVRMDAEINAYQDDLEREQDERF